MPSTALSKNNVAPRQNLLLAINLVLFITYLSYMVLSMIHLGKTARLITWSWLKVAVTLIIAPLSLLVADFFSGFVHFLGDNFGSPTTPFFGPHFVMPFRVHHLDPTEITRHSFLHVNGSNILIVLPILITTYYLLTTRPSFVAWWFSLFILAFLLFIFLTNQIHKWAHSAPVPTVVKWLQDRRVILSPSHHDIHHTSPFDTYYCITVGWLNPLLQQSGFFEGIIRLVRGGQKK